MVILLVLPLVVARGVVVRLVISAVAAVGTGSTSAWFFLDRPRANKRFRRPMVPSLDPPPMLSSLDLLLITILSVASNGFPGLIRSLLNVVQQT